MTQLTTPFTNEDYNIYGLVNLPEVVKGALLSRYSRSTESLRTIYDTEFAQAATLKADAFYERVLIGYGDDSIAELGNAQIACEDISILAAKALQDCRVGLSFIEKSTRYVDFTKRSDGKKPYYIPMFFTAQEQHQYILALDGMFEDYSEVLAATERMLSDTLPQPDDVSYYVYAKAIKAKAFDLTRGLLPLATLTSVGISGNGRAFEQLLIKLNSSSNPELVLIATQIHQELSKTMAPFVKRVEHPYGLATSKYLADRKMRLDNWVANYPDPDSLKAEATSILAGATRLIQWELEEDALVSIAYNALAELGYKPNLDTLTTLDVGDLVQLLKEYIGTRAVRQHKVGRALESVRYQLEVDLDIGAWRDLQRHRCLSQAVSQFTFPTGHGFYLPELFKKNDVGYKYIQALDDSQEWYDTLQTPYAVPLAATVQWTLDINLREAVYLCELRSGEQGHESYRQVAIDIYNAIAKVHPTIAAICFQHVNLNQYPLSRLSSETKQEAKQKRL